MEGQGKKISILHIYIVPLDIGTSYRKSDEPYFKNLNLYFSVIKVKIKSIFHIYITPLVDWYQGKKYRQSRSGGKWAQYG